MSGLVVLAAVAVGLLVLHTTWRRERPRRPESCVELRFDAHLGTESAAAVLAAISGLRHGARVIVELWADERGLRHRLRAEPAAVDVLRGQLRGLLPGLRLAPVDAPAVSWSAAVRLGWGRRHPLLRTDKTAEAAAALLGSLSPLGRGEVVLLRWSLSPARPPRLTRSSSAPARPANASLLGWLLGHRDAPHDHHLPLRAKYAGPLLRARGVLAVRAASPGRAGHLLGRILAVLRTRRGQAGRLAVRRLAARRIADSAHGARGGDLLSPGELLGLIGWPIDAPRVPGLTLGTAPQLIPSDRIPRTGRVIGKSSWPGIERPLAQPVTGALSHTLVVGPTGVGKSALLANLILQDLAAGRGCLVLDGKGDLAADVLDRVPEARAGEVIVLDPADARPVPGLRLFGDGADPELAADLVLGVFRDLFADAWGPRSEQWLRAGLVTLAHAPGATLADLPFVFSNDAYRRRLVGVLADPLLRRLWASYESMGPAERAQQLAAPLNKLDQLIGRRRLRAILGQAAPTLDFTDVLRRGQVVVVSLAAGRIGAPAARLLGALVVYQLFAAAQGRAAVAPPARRPFLAYLDEPRVLGDLPVPLDALFEMARGFGVGLTLAAQSVSQLPRDLQRAVLTNAATLVAFRQAADDARLVARELSPVTAEELGQLGAFEMVARIGLGPGDVAPAVTGRTLPLAAATGSEEAVRRLSAARYGVDAEAVDAALAARHEGPSPAGPVGRTRRSR